LTAEILGCVRLLCTHIRFAWVVFGPHGVPGLYLSPGRYVEHGGDPRAAGGALLIYIDTSVLAAYYCPEPLSAVVQRFLRRQADALHLAVAGQAQARIVTTDTDLARAARVLGVGVEMVIG